MTTQASKLSIFAGLMLALTGCAPSSYVVLLENPEGGTGKVTVSAGNAQTELDQASQGAALDGSETKPFMVAQEKIQQDFGAALAAQPVLPKRFALYFDTGGTRLTPEAERTIPEILDEIRKHPAADISVIGHTDTVGRAEDNERLALDRARFIETLFQSYNLNMREITTTSHGESNLLIKTPDETSEPLNRRVEVTVR